jgi:hypothetical protein
MRAPVPRSQVVRRAAWQSVRAVVRPAHRLDRSPQHAFAIAGMRGLDVVAHLGPVPAPHTIGVVLEVRLLRCRHSGLSYHPLAPLALVVRRGRLLVS